MSTFQIVGNLTADPELRFTPNGAAVVSFTIAHTPRYFDRTTQEWKDSEALFMRCTAWNDQAENIAESLSRGNRVVAFGTLKQRSYTDREDVQRTVIEMTVDEIGPSLKFASATVRRAERATVSAPEPTPEPESRATRGSSRRTASATR